jgi:hypothetical protein
MLTPYGQGPKFLLRDNDAKFGRAFDAAATGVGTRVVRTPVMAPKANCYVERLIGSLRRECLDHLLIVSEAHLQNVLDEYCDFSTTHDRIKALARGDRERRKVRPWPLARRSTTALSLFAQSSADSITITSSPHDRRACADLPWTNLSAPTAPRSSRRDGIRDVDDCSDDPRGGCEWNRYPWGFIAKPTRTWSG